MSQGFIFQEFTINHDICGMKVGTDSVLLGAWANKPTDSPHSVLDIGTGTGIIALMMAQRFPDTEIHGIEIDHQAFLQAVGNVSASRFADRIHLSEGDFLKTGFQSRYDIIISNPPFFSVDTRTRDSVGEPNRYTARHTDSLPFCDLIERTKDLLADDGLFSVVIPYGSALHFIGLCAENGLYLTHKCNVKDSPNKEFKRSLMTFSKTVEPTQTTELTIRDQSGTYSLQFRSLTEIFYLPTLFD